MRYTQCVMTVQSYGLHFPLPVPEICRSITPRLSRKVLKNWCTLTSTIQGESTRLMGFTLSILSRARSSGVTHRTTLSRRRSTLRILLLQRLIQARSSIAIEQRSIPLYGIGFTVLTLRAMHVQVTGRMAARYRISLGASALRLW